MIEFGYTLRKAREAKGLTTKDIAQSTHMMVQMVEDLENENFAKIAAPIYGRGFVKLYCEAVGIEAKPLINEFMEIYNGNRPATIRMREPAESARPAVAVPPPVAENPIPAAPEPEPIPAAVEPEPEPVAVEPEPIPQDVPAAEEPSVAEEPVAEPFAEEVTATEPPKPADDSLFSFRYDQPAKPVEPAQPFRTPEPAPLPEPERPAFRGPSRYAAPIPIDDQEKRGPSFKIDIPPAVWRILVLAAGAFLILWLLLSGVRALYRATMTVPSEPETVEERQQVQSEPAPQKPSAAPATDATAPRTPRTIAPLYID